MTEILIIQILLWRQVSLLETISDYNINIFDLKNTKNLIHSSLACYQYKWIIVILVITLIQLQYLRIDLWKKKIVGKIKTLCYNNTITFENITKQNDNPDFDFLWCFTNKFLTNYGLIYILYNYLLVTKIFLRSSGLPLWVTFVKLKTWTTLIAIIIDPIYIKFWNNMLISGTFFNIENFFCTNNTINLNYLMSLINSLSV